MLKHQLLKMVVILLFAWASGCAGTDAPREVEAPDCQSWCNSKYDLADKARLNKACLRGCALKSRPLLQERCDAYYLAGSPNWEACLEGLGYRE